MRRALLLALLAVIVFAVPGPAAADPPAADEIAGARIAGIFDEPVTLTGGVYSGEPFVPGAASRPRLHLAPHLRLAGDLDGDGRADEVAVLLAESSGGSGSLVHLAVLGQRDGRVQSLATAPLGDRVQVRSAELAGGEVVLRVVQAGPEDAACCPSQTATRSFRLAGGALKESPARDFGTLSLATLAGTTWVLSRFGWQSAAPAEPRITLTLDGQRASGSSGCNRYFAEAKAGEKPGHVSFGPIGGTQMACPEPAAGLESRYLEALGRADRFAFLAGQLALAYREGHAVRSLIFRPEAPGELSP